MHLCLRIITVWILWQMMYLPLKHQSWPETKPCLPFQHKKRIPWSQNYLYSLQMWILISVKQLIFSKWIKNSLLNLKTPWFLTTRQSRFKCHPSSLSIQWNYIVTWTSLYKISKKCVQRSDKLWIGVHNVSNVRIASKSVTGLVRLPQKTLGWGWCPWPSEEETRFEILKIDVNE